jgi:Do/DeqQ family serine protease
MRAPLLILLLLTAVPVVAETRVPQSSSEISLSFAPVVRAAAPAVVNIYARRLVETRRSIFADDPVFGGFFEQFQDPRPQVQNSLGSGVIVSKSGMVVSNFHVVGNSTDIRVVLKDRREISANVLLADRDSDLAILQLDEAEVSDLAALELRDSDTVEVGELVLAIGNPFGVGQTVSSGIVSGLARTGIMAGNARGYFIQTDAAINPGNSGGALVDARGRLIGINTSILTRSGGSNGIGFAIPANLVRRFVEQAEDGRTSFARPWAGVAAQPVSDDIAKALGMSRPDGIVITELHPLSPLRVAGLEVGDVVVAVDGQPVTSPPEMIFRMSVTGIGETAKIAFLSDGASREAIVALELPPEIPPRAEYRAPERNVFAGFEAANINPAIEQEMSIELPSEGVVVTSPGRLGSRVGLRAGDVLVRVNGREVADTSQIEPALKNAGRSFSFEVLRGGRTVSFRFRI